jgi:hypothetical protein
VRKIASGTCSVREWAVAVGRDQDTDEMRGEGEGRREGQEDGKRRRRE